MSIERLMRWVMPAGVLWTREDELNRLMDEVRVMWLGKNIHMAELQRLVAIWGAGRITR